MADRAAFTTTTTPQFPLGGQDKVEVERGFITEAAREFVTEEKRAASAVFTVGAEATDVSTINIQLKDRNGDNIAYRWVGWVINVEDTYEAVADCSTGLAVGTSTPDGGVIGTAITKGAFLCASDTTGSIDLKYTDSESDRTTYVGVILDGGYTVFSGDLRHGGA